MIDSAQDTEIRTRTPNYLVRFAIALAVIMVGWLSAFVVLEVGWNVVTGLIETALRLPWLQIPKWIIGLVIAAAAPALACMLVLRRSIPATLLRLWQTLQITVGPWCQRSMHDQRFWTATGALCVAVLALIMWDAMNPQDFEERNELLRTYAQIGGGSLLAIGAYWTAQNVLVNREGHINDRYIRAIALLNANDDHGRKQLETRIGAILILEKIAHDSASHQRAVMESLAAYVRSNSQVDLAKRELWKSWDQLPDDYEDQIRAEIETFSCPPDIQQAMSVIARRRLGADRDEPLELNFEGADLRKIEISGAYFPKCNFNSCDLSGARLWDVSFDNAQFWASNLSKTYVMRGSMTNAHLPKAIVVDSIWVGIDMTAGFADSCFWKLTDLHHVTLDRMNLGDSDFERASFRQGSYDRSGFHESKFIGAHFWKADLTSARGITREMFESATRDKETLPPRQFWPI